jgi:autotransporter-associated beta strand protein
LFLTGTNTYTGATTVSAGMLSVPGTNALGGTSTLITVANGGGLVLQGMTAFGTRNLSIAGSGNLSEGALRFMSGVNSAAGSVTMSADATIGIDGGATLNLTGTLAGGVVGLTKSGWGILNLTGTNTFGGSTTVSAGTLNIKQLSALGTGSSTTYKLVMGTDTTLGLNLGGTGEFDSGSATNLIANRIQGSAYSLGLDTGNASGASFSYGSDLTAQNLIKSGTGSLVLSGALNYANTLINAGTLQFGSLTAGSGPGTGFISVGSGATLAFARTGTVTSVGTLVSGSGNVSVVGGTVAFTGTNSYTGGTRISGGTLEFATGGLGTAGSITFAGSSTLRFGLGNTMDMSTRLSVSTGTRAIFDTNGNDVTFASAFLSGTVSLGKAGAGTLTLSASNTFTSGVAIDGGLLQLGTAGAIGSAGSITFGGGTLRYVTGLTTDFSGRFTSVPVGVTAGVDLGANNVTFATALSGSGGLAKYGNGTLTLSGSNALLGGVTLNAGSLLLNNNGALGSGTFTLLGGTIGVVNASGVTASWNMAQNWQSDFIFRSAFNLSMGTGAITLAGTSRVIDVGANQLTLGGAIGDGGAGYGLTKSGTGTLVLAGSSTYEGAMLINAGIVNLQNSLALGGTLAGTTVGSGATLQLQGGINVGNEA